MPYEKYIKKNGKVYGPYYYKSKRVGDKVISEYIGEKAVKKPVPKKFLTFAITFAIVLVVAALIIFSLISGFFSGKTVSESETFVAPITGEVVNTETITVPDIDEGEFKQTSRVYKNWIIVTFQMGNLKEEYSYSNTLSQENLNILIERDKEAWLDKIFQ